WTSRRCSPWGWSRRGRRWSGTRRTPRCRRRRSDPGRAAAPAGAAAPARSPAGPRSPSSTGLVLAWRPPCRASLAPDPLQDEAERHLLLVEIGRPVLQAIAATEDHGHLVAAQAVAADEAHAPFLAPGERRRRGGRVQAHHEVRASRAVLRHDEREP